MYFEVISNVGRVIFSQHSRLLAETKEKEPDVIFIGDQIIQELQQRPIWNDIFEPLHSLNLGISHDCTENVLYRIQDGVLDNIKPKVSFDVRKKKSIRNHLRRSCSEMYVIITDVFIF